MRLQSYIQSATTILELYKGNMPFAVWLKGYFRDHKKFGGRDRKLVADLCFCYFRLGQSFQSKSVQERFLLAQFLCYTTSVFIEEMKQEWKEHQSLSIKEKISFLGEEEKHNFFPLLEEVSESINKEDFEQSLLIQPDLFLRIRPGKEKILRQKLSDHEIHFAVKDDCITVANSTKVDEIILIDAEAVVQDASSQKVLEELKNNFSSNRFQSWDCCAASGGKTILLHDLYPGVQLTVSDIRESILYNLRARFNRAGIHHYQTFLADLSSDSFQSSKKFDVIICDAPCSGSGTWSRAPDQMIFFKKGKIEYYTTLQKKIAANASKALKNKGYFVYITCSVFSKENEEVVDFLCEHAKLTLVSSSYIQGYQHKADTLFTALFTT